MANGRLQSAAIRQNNIIWQSSAQRLNPAQRQYRPEGRNPRQGQYPTGGRNSAQGQYPTRVRNPAQGQYPTRGRNPRQGQYPTGVQNVPAYRSSAQRPPAPVKARQRRRKRRQLLSLTLMLLLCTGLVAALRSLLPNMVGFESGLPGSYDKSQTKASTDPQVSGQTDADRDFSQELQKLLELNGEAKDYVEGYPDRNSYLNGPIDLSEDFVSGQVPLLMQWDKRWGYDAYGDSMIGLAGCGPLCMTQAYLYFTEDTQMNPRKMADFAYENGYYTSQGTSWSLWTEGAEKLGLTGRELSLDQSLMQRTLDAGDLIVCSMRPGDFTTAGHFILIRGYDENGFYVNDPNRRSNSSRQWDFDTLQYQIRNLWALGSPD